MSGSVFSVLAAAAVSVGSIHSAAPDHWVPFAAVARAQGWSSLRTARVTALCGLGHVTASVLLGLLGLGVGLELLQTLGQKMEAVAGVLLVAFGLTYAAWAVRRAAGKRLHGHLHVHYDHVHDPASMTAWALFLIFSADPCVAVMPLMFAAAPLGPARTLATVLLYEGATIATMVALTLPARAVAQHVRGAWTDRYGDAAAGGVIALAGAVVVALGW